MLYFRLSNGFAFCKLEINFHRLNAICAIDFLHVWLLIVSSLQKKKTFQSIYGGKTPW